MTHFADSTPPPSFLQGSLFKPQTTAPGWLEFGKNMVWKNPCRSRSEKNPPSTRDKNGPQKIAAESWGRSGGNLKNYLVVSHNNGRAPDVDDDGDDADDDVDENGDEEVPPLVGRCAFMNKHTSFGGGGTANSCTALHSCNQNQEGWVRGKIWIVRCRERCWLALEDAIKQFIFLC